MAWKPRAVDGSGPESTVERGRAGQVGTPCGPAAHRAAQVGVADGPVPVPWKPNSVLPPAATVPL
ncbi:hypothetical protein Ade02nite_94590 [Paractinoplanes deccanensis]|uniref:Uncharacterized protein n=1 Tax=Paractinoplanes deccanensis TaxID=113561 RepID=A0ABQ3YLD8_9ACTN|nr:hypothetical protein Ade02nite_94590 [Actinoplanes deccanensis]